MTPSAREAEGFTEIFTAEVSPQRQAGGIDGVAERLGAKRQQPPVTVIRTVAVKHANGVFRV